MKVKMIGCASTMNEVKWLGIPENFDYEFLDYSYHGNVVKLRKKLQEIIDKSQDYDLIILTYSRCSNAVLGLISPKVPLLFPATHDCIGLLLGSNERHLELVRNNVGTYFFSQGWLDYGRDPRAEYEEYKIKYGEKKAKVLIDALYGRYKKAMLIITPGMKNLDLYRQKVKEIADYFGWETDEIKGDIGLLSGVLRGEKGSDIVYVEPGQPVTEELLRPKKF